MRISDWSSDVCSSDLCSTSPWPKPWGVAFARPPQRQTATRNSGLTDDGRSHARRESPRRKQPTSPQNGKAKAPIPPFRGRPDPYRRLLWDMVAVHRGGGRKHGERLHQGRGIARTEERSVGKECDST